MISSQINVTDLMLIHKKLQLVTLCWLWELNLAFVWRQIVI